MSIGILGAGAFGTALAISLGRKQNVVLWSRSVEQAEQTRKRRINSQHLPGISLPEAVSVTSDPGDLNGIETLLLSVPMQQLRSLLSRYSAELRSRTLVACCKGIELDTGSGPLDVIASEIPGSVGALLTGPSFAHDIAAGLPTALSIACSDEALGKRLQSELTTSDLRLYRTTDTTGAEIGGALKNVIAIACGAVMGAGLGVSARAALMTRGYAEMVRFAVSRGARPETLAGLSGLGDLTLTCTSDLSRNYRLGMAIGAGTEFDPAITVEGAATARAVAEWAEQDMPITGCVVDLLDRNITMAEAVTRLLARPLRPE